jgi:hypothetical protein
MELLSSGLIYIVLKAGESAGLAIRVMAFLTEAAGDLRFDLLSSNDCIVGFLVFLLLVVDDFLAAAW